MSDPTFNEVAQFAHVGWGFLLVTVPVLLTHQPAWVFAIPVAIGAAVKEYSDAHGGESPAIAGNSWEDFGFWSVGIALAILVLHFN